MDDEWRKLLHQVTPSSMKLKLDISLNDINTYLKKWPSDRVKLGPKGITKEQWEKFLNSKPLADIELVELLHEMVFENMKEFLLENNLIEASPDVESVRDPNLWPLPKKGGYWK